MRNSPYFPNGIVNGADWYVVSGGMQDWHYRYLGCKEITLELSDIKWPNETTLPGYWEDNRESMLAYMETIHSGVRGVVTDAVTGEPVWCKVSVAGNSQPVFTDADVGDYHRMLMPETYDLIFSAPGYENFSESNVVVAAGESTRLDVQLIPLSPGRQALAQEPSLGRSVGISKFDGFDAVGVPNSDAARPAPVTNGQVPFAKSLRSFSPTAAVVDWAVSRSSWYLQPDWRKMQAKGLGVEHAAALKEFAADETESSVFSSLESILNDILPAVGSTGSGTAGVSG
jgi:hypothetical protein